MKRKLIGNSSCYRYLLVGYRTRIRQHLASLASASCHQGEVVLVKRRQHAFQS